MTSPTWDFQML